MKTEMSRSILPIQGQLTSSAVLASLPRLEELSESNRQELVLALAALLLHDPDLQALLALCAPEGEVHHELQQ